MPEQVKVVITPHPVGDTTVWSATVNGATFPLVTYGMELVDGRPMVSLVVDTAYVQAGEQATPPPVQPEAPAKTSTWGDPTIPDPREQIPGWSPSDKLMAQVATNLEAANFGRGAAKS